MYAKEYHLSEKNPKSNIIGLKLWVNMFPYITFEIKMPIK